MFTLSEGLIGPKEVINHEAGAYVTFEGVVRNHNNDKPVESLEYEVYPSMALKEGRKIVEEVLSKYGLLDAYCIHRSIL